MTEKEFVLDTLRRAGKSAAVNLQAESPSMTGTELCAAEEYIPDFQAARTAKNMLERKAGQKDGFVCRSSAGRVVRLLQVYDSEIYPQEPEELPAQWGFVWSTDPDKALPFLSPLHVPLRQRGLLHRWWQNLAQQDRHQHLVPGDESGVLGGSGTLTNHPTQREEGCYAHGQVYL